MFESGFQDGYVKFDGKTLTIGNSCMERTWDMTGQRPAVREMRDKRDGRAWLTLTPESQWEEWPKDTFAFYKAGITEGEMRVLDIEAKDDNDLGFARPYLQVTVSLAFDGFQVDWIHVIYPGLPVMRSWLRAKAAGQRCLPNMERAAEWPEDYQDWLPLPCLFIASLP